MEARKTFLLLILILLLSSCSETPKPVINGDTTIATLPLTQISPIPSPEVIEWDWNDFPNMTPIPTISSQQKEDLLHLLTSSICNLPCYLDIEPGKTLIVDAKNKVTQLGGILHVDYENFYEGYPEVQPLSFTSYMLDVESLFLINIGIYGKEKKVEQFIFNVLSNFEPFFYEILENHFVESIFKNYGEPDEVLIHKGQHITIRAIYYQYKTIIDWSIFQEENINSCYKLSKNNLYHFQIILLNNGIETPFASISSSHIGFEEMWKSTNDVFGVNKRELYEAIISNPDTCFKLK